MIHAIGDSHTCFFLGVNRKVWRVIGKSNSYYPFFKVHYVGPATAYGLANIGSQSQGRKNLFTYLNKLSKGSTILLCFGEIDCREHIPKHKNPEGCVLRYLKVVSEIKQRGFKVLLWGVVSRKKNKVVEEFNKYLKEKAKELNIEVIDMYKKFVGKDEYFIDDIHLSQNAMPIVLEELKRKSLV